jgi:predicted RND superfamily exporter protein
MLERFFSRGFELAFAHKRLVLIVVGLISVAAAIGLSFVRYEGSVDVMLPPDPEVVRSMRFLKDSSLSDKVIISLTLNGADRDKSDLFRAVDQLAASLEPPLFTKVMSGVSMADAMDEFSVLRYGPQILSPGELAAVDAQLNGPSVEFKLKQIYLQSFRPESVFMSSFSRSDPLGIKTLLYDKLKALPSSMGYDVVVEDGRFLSRDGRHSMVIVQTSVPMTDATRSKALLRELDAKIRLLPGYISADVIAGHRHTVSNEQVIKRDIAVASLVASVGFIFLFLFVFRDARAFFVILFPLLAVVWAILIQAILQGTLSYLVIGFGTAIVGVSDFGLIVYIAIKRGTDRSQMGKLGKLVFIDAITTIFSFVVLVLSQTKGYQQLAVFSVVCLTICLLFSLFVLPLTLSWKRFELVPDPTIGDRLKKFRWPVKTTLVVWTVLTAVMLLLAAFMRFDSDVKKLDGSSPAVLQAEERFHEVWGGKTNQAILVVTGRNLEETMEANDRMYREATSALGREEFTSLARFWPSEKSRRENQQNWDRFWREGRERSLRGLILEKSPAFGFSEHAFDPFFDGLYSRENDAAPPGGMIARLQERFVVNRDGECRIMSFFPDNQKNLDALAPVAKNNPGTFIVSGTALSSSISRFTTGEMYILAPLAVLFNIVLTWLFFRSWAETMIALVPLLTGVIWMLGIMSLFNMPLNIVNIVAGVIASGVIVDYGVGITYEYRHNLHFGTVMAMTLSAASNVIGAGALLFAKHPALYSTGVAMVISMVVGYLTSVLVVPSFCSILPARAREQVQ